MGNNATIERRAKPALARHAAGRTAAAPPSRSKPNTRQPGRTGDGASPTSPAQRARPAAELVVALQTEMVRHQDFRAVATAACLTLANALRASRVSIGWVAGGLCDPVASSTGSPALMGDDDCDAIAQAMQECVLQQRSIFSDSNDQSNTITLAAQQLAASMPDADGAVGSVISVPLAVNRQAIGALSVEFYPRHRQSVSRQFPVLLQTLEAAVPVVSRLLQLERDKELPWTRLLWKKLVTPAGRRNEQQRRQRRWLVALGSAALLTLLLLPMQMTISGDARIEGAVQRLVVSPVNGYLQQVHVYPGDPVRANQVMASLGNRELQLEQDRLQGLISEYQADVSSAISIGDRTAMAVARSRADQAGAELALVREKLERSRVRAPFDGIVIEGDWRQQVGSPVDRGQNLFTVAPDNAWRVRIEIDERDILLVNQALQGELYLSSLPWQQIPVTVTRVAPAASVVDGGNVFEVLASIDAPPDGIRPGLRGSVQLPGRTENLLMRVGRRLGYLFGHYLWRWQPW